MLRARLLELSADYTDIDWMNPASPPPDGVPRLRAIRETMKFALRGRDGVDDDAAVVDLGAMTVDAYAAVELPGGGYTRGKSLKEVEGTALEGAIILVTDDLATGSTVRIHLELVGVSAPVIELLLLDGGRVLL